MTTIKEPVLEVEAPSPTIGTPMGSSISGILHIPESKDGFFGYSEEKSLQHV